MDPLTKLDELLKKFREGGGAERDVALIASWEPLVKRGLLIGDLANHDGVKLWLSEIDKDIEAMNQILLTTDSKTLPDHDRDRLLDRKTLYEKFRDFFHIAHTNLDATVKKIEENLNA